MVVAQAAPAVLVALATLLIVVASAETENLLVTCGSSIKLQHVATKHRLHSHQVAYSRGSQQQSVTAYATGDDANSVWVVRGPEDAQCQPGTPFKKGQRIKLQHNPTRKWLHSHQFQSPLSGNQEVSAFGSDTETDGGDHWTIEWEGKAKVWKQETKVRFKHVDTGAYLYAHDMKYGNPIAGQLEVCATHRKDRNAEWQAAEGVYMPAAGKNGKGAAIDKEEL